MLFGLIACYPMAGFSKNLLKNPIKSVIVKK